MVSSPKLELQNRTNKQAINQYYKILENKLLYDYNTFN